MITSRPAQPLRSEAVLSADEVESIQGFVRGLVAQQQGKPRATIKQAMGKGTTPEPRGSIIPAVIVGAAITVGAVMISGAILGTGAVASLKG